MGDGLTLAADVVETTAYFAAPALLWLFAYLLAYREGDLARSAGFDRLTFWLLIPGALVGEFANILIFGWRGDLLAINVGGGLIPAGLSLWLLGRGLEARRRWISRILLALVVGAGVALASQLLPLAPIASDALVVVGLLGPAAVVAAAWARPGAGSDPDARKALGLLALFGATGLATFATTATVPGTGIVSNFPSYLLIPTAAGAVATYALRRGAGVGDGPCLALSYAGVTLGELVGADVLHQPPLYTGGTAALYAIGGAGLLDLLHLSGLLALAGAYAVVWYARRPRAIPSTEPRAPSSAVRRIRRAWYLGLQGEYGPSLREADAATHEALGSLRRLAEMTPADPQAPWAGIAVPPWVSIDQANLDAAAATVTDPSGREAYRSWLTARALVGTALSLATPLRPTGPRRATAFAIDLGILALIATSLDLALVGSTTGPLGPVLNGIALNAAVVGAVGWGLVYFVAFEGLTGSTPGKRLLGLRVRPRTGPSLDPRALGIRNLPRIVPLTILAYGVGLFVAVLTHPAHADQVLGLYGGSGAFLAEVAAIAAIGLALTGLVSLLTIGATEEGQRLGDVVAGTWVLRVPGVPAPVRRRAVGGASRPGAG